MSTQTESEPLPVEGAPGTASVIIRRDGALVHSGDSPTEQCGVREPRDGPAGNVEYSTRAAGHFIRATRSIANVDGSPVPEEWKLSDYYDASTDSSDFYGSEWGKTPLKVAASQDLRTVRLAGTLGLMLDMGTYDLDVTFRCGGAKEIAAAAEAEKAERRKNPVTVEGFPWCISEDAYEQISTAIAAEDQRAIDYLTENGQCHPLVGGLPVTVINRTFTRVHVRVYGEGRTMERWTYKEAVDDGR